jgi:hypothetical protein
MPDSFLMTFRAMAQMLQIAVLPEISRRFSSGKLSKPLHLTQFRFSQKVLPDHSVEPIVELNNEVQLILHVKARRPIVAGQSSITLSDIYPEECFIDPPFANNKPMAYFLCQAAFLNFFNFFDFTPNAPDFLEAKSAVNVPYPILDFINAKNLHDTIHPVRQIQSLAAANWPPAPGYYPSALIAAHKDPAKIANPPFVEIVADAYNRNYWDEHFAFWEETNFFPNRISYLRKAVDEFFAGDFIASIFVLVPHFEGIVKDYLRATRGAAPSGFKSALKQLKDAMISRGVFMFPPQVLETIFSFLEQGSFWRDTGSLTSPAEQVNRHGIAHGVFTGFESKGIALKYLVLMDSLAFILLHDKILTGNL